MRKLFTLAVGLGSVGEVLISCLLLASLITRASCSSKRVDILPHRNGFGKSKLFIDQEMVEREHERIAFIKGKLNMLGEEVYEETKSSTQTPVYSGQTIGTVNYIMKVGLGTPAKDLLLVIDTGSDLAWVQCLPCVVPCYQQQDPIFDPTASSSYQQVPCASAQCAQLGPANSAMTCSTTNATDCDYRITYLDGSSTAGDFALETLIVGGEVASAAYPFGCGHENQGLFQGMDGLLGLSRDELAFPAQTEAVFGVNFAYCLPNIFSSTAGYIEFGAASRGIGVGIGGVVSVGVAGSESTPLVYVSETTVYVVELEYVQVEGTSNVSRPPTSMAMVVDSGTVITRLDRPLYEHVRDSFKEAAAAMNAPPLGPPISLFDTCYTLSGAQVFPSITFTFMGDLVFTPSGQNSVVPIENDNTVCLALLPLDSTSGISILGNYQQQNHLFTFDIAHSTLSISSDVSC